MADSKRKADFVSIRKEDILWAMNQIDQHPVPEKFKSTAYDVVHNSKYYPPKWVIKLAYEQATGKELSLQSFTTLQANAVLKSLKFTVEKRKKAIQSNNDEKDLDIHAFIHDINQTNLVYGNDLLAHFILALLTKPFVILSGLSGSGKTKLALTFVKWISRSSTQYKVVPVGADWTNREPLLGYPNALDPASYICPENNVIDLLQRANKDPYNPYFLILDEMNLSHVERYFADFLSTMESGEPIPLYDGAARVSSAIGPIEQNILLPNNFFIIGTMNVDETTYMFSPKVLDRAQVIEFRVTEKEMTSYLKKTTFSQTNNNKDNYSHKGTEQANRFILQAKRPVIFTDDSKEPLKHYLHFFHTLKKVGAEYGYRTASEIIRFHALARKLYKDWTEQAIIDHAIIQKLLPKLHGSRKKIVPILEELWKLCLIEGKAIPLETKQPTSPFTNFSKYPVSAEKIWRMYKNACDNGYTSFAEA